MFRQALVATVLAALLSAFLSVWLSSQPEAALPRIYGRNNTVLYLTDSSGGLSNSHIASALTILENHLDIQIYWASFANPAIEPRLRRVSDAVGAKNPQAKPIIFHEMGTKSLMDVLHCTYPTLEEFITDYGLAGYGKMLSIVEKVLMPWTVDEYFAIFEETMKLIEEVDPNVIVVDNLQRPFIDATRNSNRLYAMLSPNALTDIIAYRQPWGSMFWKYPAMMSGNAFPVPWQSILSNIWMQMRFMWTIIASAKLSAARSELEAKGIKDPINMHLQWDDVPLLSGDLPEGGLPLAYYPPNVTVCGPMVLDTAPAEQQNPEVFRWLGEAKSTMLVCLGGNMKYDERRAKALGTALLHVLEMTDTQILWKFVKDGDYGDDWQEPLESYIKNGRLRLERWLTVDPVSLMNTGKIDVWVHHGGANCYYEAAISGVRQVILPLWFDLYNFAMIAEYTGVGIWPGKEIAPVWDSESLSEGFMAALEGKKAELMQIKATALKEAASRYHGRECAADHIARMASVGH